MAALRASASSSVVAQRPSAPRFAPLPARRSVAVRAQAQQESRDVPAPAVAGFITASTLGSLLASAPSAHAAAEVMQLAAGDNRLSILLTLFVPALGWVAFNIAGGLFGQLEKMKDRQVGPESRSLRVKRSVAGAMGLGAAGLLASAQTAEASELMQLAAGDNRLSILLTLFVPALGWVAFNIAGGLFGQLEKMKDRQVGPESRSLRVKRSVAGAMGLGAAGLLASAQTAEASELMQLAAGDNRLSILLTLFVPALGWVAFNIAGGLFGQLEKMKDRQVGPESRSLRVKRSVAGAMGLGAAGLLASAQTAEASELMQVAAGDNRLAILLTLFVPALAWVGFNIAGGLFNQLDKMSERQAPPEARSIRRKK